MGWNEINKNNLFDDKRDAFFSISNLGSQWSHHHEEEQVYPIGGLFASMSQNSMGMGFGSGIPQPNSSDSSSKRNNGMKIPCTELYIRYVQSEGKVKIHGVADEDEEDEIVEGVKRKKKGSLKKFKIKVKNPSLRRLISGAFAGAISRTAVAPLETIRTHLMVGSSGHSTGEVFKNIMESDGWKGLFRGNFVNVIRVAPSKAIEVIIMLMSVFNFFCYFYFCFILCCCCC
jgi:solute carrier family 25 phosphate transporter 23/24/25/41